MGFDRQDDPKKNAGLRHELARLRRAARRVRGECERSGSWPARRELQRLYDRMARVQSQLKSNQRGDWWQYRNAA